MAFSILTLALSAGVTTFSLASNLFLRPPNLVPNPGLLTRANRFSDQIPANLWTYPDFEFFRQHTAGSIDLAAYTGSGRPMTGESSGTSLSVSAVFVSSNYFRMLGIRPASGRWFLPDEEELSTGLPVAIASYGFADRTLGGVSNAVGRQLSLNGHPLTILGVAPQEFQGISPTEASPDVWIPLALQPLLNSSAIDWLRRPTGSNVVWLQAVGRRLAGVSLEQAQAQVDVASAELGREHPEWAEKQSGVELLSSYRYGPREASRLQHLLLILGGATALMIAIAVLNLAVLFSVRVLAERRDFGIRLALGARTQNLASGLLLQGLIVSSGAGVVALALCTLTTRWAVSLLPYQPSLQGAPDWRILSASLMLSLLVAVGSTLLPSLHLRRLQALDLIKFSSSSRGSTGSSFGDVVVVTQLSLAVLLVAMTVLLARSLTSAISVDFGFDVENREVLSFDLEQHGYSAPAALQFVEQATGELAGLPGVESVCAVTNAPFRGMMVYDAELSDASSQEVLPLGVNFISPGFFETMGIPLREGRAIRVDDVPETMRVAIVNQAAAQRLWPGKSALGQSLVLVGSKPRTIIGVAANSRFTQLHGEPEPYAFVPLAQATVDRVSIIAKLESNGTGTRQGLRESLQAIDPAVSITSQQTLQEITRTLTAPYRFSALLVGGIAAMALFLSALGLYGVLAYQVVQKRRAIGIRMALGATSMRIARIVVQRAIVLTSCGVLVGLFLAWSSARWIESLLFGVSPHDWVSYFAVPFILVSTACLASLLPAWRASRVDPLEVLREQ